MPFCRTTPLLGSEVVRSEAIQCASSASEDTSPALKHSFHARILLIGYQSDYTSEETTIRSDSLPLESGAELSLQSEPSSEGGLECFESGIPHLHEHPSCRYHYFWPPSITPTFASVLSGSSSFLSFAMALAFIFAMLSKPLIFRCSS